MSMPQASDDMTAQSTPSQIPSRRPLSSVAARMMTRARKAWADRQFEDAEQSLTNVLALAPDDADAIRMLGMVAQRRSDHVKATDCFRRVLDVWPQDSDLRVCLGIALYEQGKVDEAVKHLRYACELAPTSAPAWFNLGEGLAREAHSHDAVAALQRAIQLDPAHMTARLSLARVQASLGRIDAAIAGFREILRRDPDNAEGWFGLSNLNTVRFDAADAASLQRALARTDLSPRTGELLRFSYAKALENQGDYAQAFESFRVANASRRRRVKWDASGEHKRIEAIERVFAQRDADAVRRKSRQRGDPDRQHPTLRIDAGRTDSRFASASRRSERDKRHDRSRRRGNRASQIGIPALGAGRDARKIGGALVTNI